MISQILCTNMAFVKPRVGVWLALISFKGLVNTARLKNMVCSYYVLLFLVITHSVTTYAKKRQRRYLIFTQDTQYGVFLTVSLPLPEPNNLVSVAWFYEANYYNVANASYFEPLLGVETLSRSREQRDAVKPKFDLTRSHLYAVIETMLDNQGYDGHMCLLRTICEAASTHFSHNGLLGDMLHLILTPSSSLTEEELQDSYYEAEYYGLDGICEPYYKKCPKSPLHEMSMDIDHLI